MTSTFCVYGTVAAGGAPGDLPLRARRALVQRRRGAAHSRGAAEPGRRPRRAPRLPRAARAARAARPELAAHTAHAGLST